MNFEAWLRSWLSRHPLKEPPAAQSKAYTAAVMSRVKSELAQEEPQKTAGLSLWVWPRIPLALAAACAGIVVAVGVSQYRSTQLAKSLLRESQQLAELAGPETEIIEADDVKTMASEWEAIDRLRLAEDNVSNKGADDAKWIDDLSKVLNQLDEDVSSDNSSSDKDTDQWLDELEMLDKTQDSASS